MGKSQHSTRRVPSDAIVQDAKTYIVTLLAWLSDAVLVHWNVQQQVRMIVLGGALVILTVALQRYATWMLVSALICGAVAVCYVRLSGSSKKV
jgi:hypothetical protein